MRKSVHHRCKAADLCAVNINDIGLVPCYDPVSLLAYSAGREYATDVWVAGQIRVEMVNCLEVMKLSDKSRDFVAESSLSAQCLTKFYQ